MSDYMAIEERSEFLFWNVVDSRQTKLLVWVASLIMTLLCLRELHQLMLQDTATAEWRFSNDHATHGGEVFEYIVVGGGAAGGAAAARLALAGRSVLLLEAGGEPGLATKIPGSGGMLLGGNYDYYYETQPNNKSCLSARGRSCRFSRGRVLGGSTAINLMMYTRGGARDYQYNVTGWTWNDIKPYFLRYEGLRDLHKLPSSSARHHNTLGVIPIGFFEDSGNPWGNRIVRGFNALKVPFNPDVNAESQIGVSKVLAYTSNGERINTAKAYLDLPGVRDNVRLLTNSKCLKVIINDNNVARGVIVSRDKRIYRYYASKEVVLSAGTVASTQLLLLSGVGPAEHLKKHNITVKSDLPVGRDMSDHVAPLVYMKVKELSVKSHVLSIGSKIVDGVQWLIKRRGPLATSGLTDISTFLNTKCYDFETKKLLHNRPECDAPTIQYIHAYLDRGFAKFAQPIYDRVVRHLPEVADQMITANYDSSFIIVTLPVLQPHSRGWIELASGNPFAPPVIAPNYLQDERDVAEIVRAIKILEDLTLTPEYRKHNASLFKYKLGGCPDGGEQGYWECYARHMTYSIHHATGTAALGRVVDARLRVSGVARLRVADLSVLPRLPTSSTTAVALAIGERVADFVIEDDLHVILESNIINTPVPSNK